MSDRRHSIARISKSLGRRELFWAGLRADDIESISDLEQVAGSFAIIGGHDRGGAVPSLVDYEDLVGCRVDLDAWDIESERESEPAMEFRHALLHCLGEPSALLPYRPSSFLSSILFARRDRCRSLGLFGPHQALFEHKPWVETHVAGLGVPHLDWSYVADEEKATVQRMLSDGPIMLRVSRSSGGEGMVRVDDPEVLSEEWPHSSEAFVGVSRFLAGATPLNIGATVWHDGVTLHHLSAQLIGIPECTTRPFGYCGNDFGWAAALDDSILDAIEESVLAVGEWLRGYGYRGTFGVDFLLHRGVAHFTEVNARFQGSTHLSSQLSGEAGESCLMLDHLSAVLGHDAPWRRPLRELMRDTPPHAHLIVHWVRSPAVVDCTPLRSALAAHPKVRRVDLESKPGLRLETGGVALRVTTADRMTTDGFDLTEPWASLVGEWLQADVRRASPGKGTLDSG